MLDRLTPAHRALFLQLLRFGIAGGLITVACVGSYWLLATYAGIDPLVANTIAFLVFSAVSYVAHSRFSFAGHGSRDRQHVRMTRFLAVNIGGYLLNQLWILLLVNRMGGPAWWPTVPMVFVTPLLTFAAHRRFVYY